MNTRDILLSIGLVVAVPTMALAPAAAQAQSADVQAEKFRLTEEMKRLAQRNAWAGVEAKYADLLALNVPLSFETHTLAAQSAEVLGKTYQVFNRLQRAVEVDPEAEQTQAEIEQIESKYGRVRLLGNERWQVELSRPAMPFAPDERKSVEYAISVAQESGAFEGMLPQGTYVVGGETTRETLEFTVEPGPEWQEIQLTRELASGSEGLIVYHGPTAMVGGAFTSTPAPSEPVFHEGQGAGHQATPATMTGPGFGVEVGYEIGFTRELAVTASFDYRNTISGGDQYHGYTGWLAALLRPGDLRIGAGPIYGRWGGQGSGVADWFDIGQDPAEHPDENIVWDGYSFAGGAKLSVSYGLMDLEPLQGVVELGGIWQTDGSRSFLGGGIRIGIVPQVPRFRE